MNKSRIASPDGSLAFLFAVFALLLWYVAAFEHIETATLLSVSLVWLLLSTGALFASLINIVRGYSRGNINLLATVLLGFIPGFDTLMTLFMRQNGVSYQPAVYGLMYMIGSIFIFAAAWRRRHQPVYMCLRTAAIGFALLLLGTGDLFACRPLLQTGGWFAFLFALLSFYYGVSSFYYGLGYSLPQGRPLFRILSSKKTVPDDKDIHNPGSWKRIVHPVPSSKKKKLPQAGRHDEISSPQMIVSFICATFGMLSFTIAFFPLSDDSILAAGMIRIVLGIIYFLSALINIFKGSPYGNLNLIFSVCFGLFAGSTMMIQSLRHLLSFDLQPTIYAVVQLFAGLYLIALIPAMQAIPLYRCLGQLCAGLGMLFSAFNAFSGSDALLMASGLCFLFFALFNIYTGVSELVPGLSQGPDLGDFLWRITARKEKSQQ